jgi:hypothetical protein
VSPLILTTQISYDQVCLVPKPDGTTSLFTLGVPGAYEVLPKSLSPRGGYHVVTKGLYVGIFDDW